MSGDSDKVLIQQIRQGNQSAWKLLIERYEGRLLAFVRRRLGDRSQAEDIVQETLVGFLTSLPNFDENRDLQTYLFTIASHKLTDHLRRLGRSPLQNLPDSDHALQKEPDHRPGASSIARSKERVQLEEEAVVRVVSEMIQQWKSKGDYTRLKVLELLFVKGWANKDIAAFLKIPDQQVANIRFAAVRKISQNLKDSGVPAEVFPGLHSEGENLQADG